MRTKGLFLIALSGLLFITGSCSDSVEPAITGVYGYASFGLSGNQMGSGILIIQLSDSQMVGQLRMGERVTIFDGWMDNQSKIELWERAAQRAGAQGLRGTRNHGTIRGDLLLNTGGAALPHKMGTFTARQIGT